TIPIKLNNQELAEVSAVKLADWIWQVVQVESPVHIIEVTRRIAEAAGIAKIGPRVKTAIERAIDYGTRQGVFRREKDFLWLPNMTQPLLRDRSQLPASARNIDLISPEEIKLFIQKAVKESYGITIEDIASATAKLMGFSRVTEDTREQIDILVEELIQTGLLAQQEGQIVRTRN
ncbi:MAG: DUF3320 domain-containing protein, partial [Bacteroidota bacterium]|nr:DUF3320 domain-containing protein [Bacteroidota bacterium]